MYPAVIMILRLVGLLMRMEKLLVLVGILEVIIYLLIVSIIR